MLDLLHIQRIVNKVRRNITIVVCTLFTLAIINLIYHHDVIHTIYNLIFCILFITLKLHQIFTKKSAPHWWDNFYSLIFAASIIGLFIWSELPPVFLLASVYILILSMHNHLSYKVIREYWILVIAVVLSTIIKVIQTHNISLALDTIVAMVLIYAILHQISLMAKSILILNRITRETNKSSRKNLGQAIAFSLQHLEINLKRRGAKLPHFLKNGSFSQILKDIENINNVAQELYILAADAHSDKIQIQFTKKSTIIARLRQISKTYLTIFKTLLLELILNGIKYSEKTDIQITLDTKSNYINILAKSEIKDSLKQNKKQLILFTTLKMIIAMVNEFIDPPLLIHDSYKDNLYVTIIKFPLKITTYNE